MSKREQDLVCAERVEQLRLRAEEEEKKKAYDDLHAKLWEKDRQEKASEVLTEKKKERSTFMYRVYFFQRHKHFFFLHI